MRHRFVLHPSIHRLRSGSQVGRTIYAHTADEPKGELIGVMDTPELAALVCEAVNAYLDRPPGERHPADQNGAQQ